MNNSNIISKKEKKIKEIIESLSKDKSRNFNLTQLVYFSPKNH